MLTWSGGTMKQSPWPQQNSPLPLRKRPREIQLSWASAIDPKDNDAANNKKRARMGLPFIKSIIVPMCSDNGTGGKKFAGLCWVGDSNRRAMTRDAGSDKHVGESPVLRRVRHAGRLARRRGRTD